MNPSEITDQRRNRPLAGADQAPEPNSFAPEAFVTASLAEITRFLRVSS